MKMKLFFSPDYGGTSLYNNKAQNLSYKYLPLTSELIKQLEEFDDSIWEIIEKITEERRKEIYENGLRLYKLVSFELGDKYEVVEMLDWIKP